MITRPPFTHLKSMTTQHGLLEHSSLNEPRFEHGYCVDDVSRAFVLICREPELDQRLLQMSELFLDFLISAIHDDGSCHNRMSIEGEWTDEPGLGDWWGRAIWALGFGAVHASTASNRAIALDGFNLLAQNRSPDLRAMSFASLGAGELLLAHPDSDAARQLLTDFPNILHDEISTEWVWPEERLGYSNGSIAEAVLTAGFALDDDILIQRGLGMLDFLIAKETCDGHFSTTPVGGRGITDTEIGFDQQPIEITSIADACVRAWAITQDPRWVEEVNLAWDWFLGNNDRGVPMFDPITGGGFDGLHFRGPNTNQGAESTISMLSTAQQAYLLETTQELNSRLKISDILAR